MQYVNLRSFTTASMVGNKEKNCGMLDIDGALQKIKSNPDEYSNAIAVTEKNNMYSVIDFYKSGLELNNNFNSIVGIHLNFAHEDEQQYQVNEANGTRVESRIVSYTYPVLLIAKNNQGYQNLCKLQTLYFQSKHSDRVTEEIALQHKALFNDLFVLSGGNGEFLYSQYLNVQSSLNTKNHEKANQIVNEMKQHILFWKELSNQNYFIELQRDGTPFENDFIKFILPIAIELNVPVVATNNTYFLNKSDFANHQLLQANSQQTKLFSSKYATKPLNLLTHIPTPENYLKSNSEMTELFKDIPVALSNSVWIAQQSKVNFELNQHNYLPEIKSPNPSENINQFFTRLANEGLDNIMLDFLDKYGTHPIQVENDYFRQFDEWRKLDVEFLSKNEKLDLIKQTNLYKKYKERLDMEISTIIEMNFPSYFLVVSDFIKWAKEHDIAVGPGRGSGAGSLVAYSLKITNLDPLQFGLLFERFLNKERVSMPDFDIDFSAIDKYKVIDYVRKKYNKEDQLAVAKIMNVSKYVTLSSIEVAAACYGIKNNHPFVKEIKEFFDEKKKKDDDIEEDDLEDEFELGDFFSVVESNKDFQLKYRNSKLFKQILDLAAQLRGNMRTVSIHAAGLVIASQSIDDILPLTRISNEEVTQLNKDNAEALGVVKFDFLSLENLNIMQHALHEINKTREQQNLPRLTLDDLDALDIYDQNVYRNIYQNGNTIDVFQFASTGMKQMLKNYRPDCFEDLIALVSLYRPGPMDIIPDYIAIKHGKKPVENLAPSNPKVAQILKETFGMMVYQEQIMQIAMEYAGYSLGGADLLRRAMGKKKPSEMAKHRGIFLDGALKNFGLPDEQLIAIKSLLSDYHDLGLRKYLDAVENLGFGLDMQCIDKIEEAMNLFDKMEKFASYGFNKSHAAAYAMVSFQTAWLKHYYPHEYFMAVLHSHIRTNKDKETVLYTTIKDAKNNHIDVIDIDINQSHENFVLNEKRQLVMPFLAMNGLNVATAKMLSNLREKNKYNADNNEDGLVFENIQKFIQASFNNNTPIKEKVLSDLVKVGAFKNLKNKESDNFYIQNSKEIVKFFALRQPKIVSPILKPMHKNLIKSSVIKTVKDDVEFKNVPPIIPLETKLGYISKILKFVPDQKLLMQLALANTKSLSLFKDNSVGLNLHDVTDSYTTIKNILSFKLEEAKNTYFNELEHNSNAKVNTFNVNTTNLIHGYVLDSYDSKYSTILKVVTEDGVLEIESKLNNFKKNTLDKFKSYCFLVKSKLGRNYDALSNSDELLIDIQLQDYFTHGDIFAQCVDNATIKPIMYIQMVDDEEKNQYSESIKNAINVVTDNKQEDLESNAEYEENSSIELPMFLTLPNGDNLPVYLDSQLYEKIEQNQLEISIDITPSILDKQNKIDFTKLNGNLTDHVNVDEMLDKLRDNETFSQILPYTILSNINTLQNPYAIQNQNGEHLIYGYIQRVYKPKMGNPTLYCVDELGTEFKISDKLDILRKYKQNEPVIFKVEYAKMKNGSHFYNLKDLYFEKDIQHLNLFGKYFVVNAVHLDKLLHDFNQFNPTIMKHNDVKCFEECASNDEYVYIGLETHTGNPADPTFVSNQLIRLNGNIDFKTITVDYEIIPLFPQKQLYLNSANMPVVNGIDNDTYNLAKAYNDYMDNNYKYNFAYIESKNNAKRITDIFTKVEQLNNYHIDVGGNHNDYVMACMLPTEIREFSGYKFLNLVDNTGCMSIKLMKEDDVFDFQSYIDKKEPLIFKIKPSKSNKANDNRVFMNLIDIYTMEDGLQALSSRIMVKVEDSNTAYQKLQEIVNKDGIVDKNKRTINITLFSGGKQLDVMPLICQYSDKLYDSIREELGLDEKQIYISINGNMGEINPNYFPDKYREKFNEANGWKSKAYNKNKTKKTLTP